jgi:hypothetical protein
LSGYNMDGVSDMVFNATFNNICYIMAVSFIGGRNWSTRRKPPDLPQVTEFYHIMLYRVGFELSGDRY